MRIWFFFSISLFLIQAAIAADTLSWDMCVNEAIQNNPDLRQARATLQASQYQIKAAGSGFYPQISANLNSSYGKNTTSNSVGLPMGTDRFSSASVSATQNLFAGFQTEGGVHQAEANAKVSEASLETTRAKVGFDLKSAYAGLLYAQNSLNLTQDIIQRRQENLKIVELRFESGNENRGSLLLSQAYLKEAQLNYLQAKDAIAVAQKQLAQVLGRDASDEMRVSGGIPVSEPDEKIDLKMLTDKTPDHLQAVAQEKAADAAVTVARAPLFPSLNLVGSVGQNDNSSSSISSNSWSVGLTLSYPFFVGGRDYYNTKAALENFSAAVSNRESVDRGLVTRLKQVFTNYVEAVVKLKVDQSFLQAATVREEIGRSKYNNGLLSFDQWDIIENDLIARQKSVLQSERDRVIGEAAWEQAQGKGVIQ
jgi:outer membrane protein